MAYIDINDPKRIAEENADIARIAANNSAKREMENGGITPLPAIPQPQMPTTQLRNGVREQIGAPNQDATAQQPAGADVPNDRGGGRIVAYGDRFARYDAGGNIVGWLGRDGKPVDAPASMSMVGGADYERGNVGTEESIRAAQDFARKSDEERRRQKAAYNIEVGTAMSAALQRAFSEGNEPVKTPSGNTYLMGRLNSDEIDALNKKLRAMGRHTIEKAGAFQNLDETGRASGDPRFVIRFKQDGAKNTAGASNVRNLSKIEFMDTIRDAYDALGKGGEADKFESAMFRDYQGENQKRREAEENRKLELLEREAKIAKIESDAEGTIAKAFGTEGIARAVARDPNAATLKILELVPRLYDQFKITNEQLTEDDGKGNKIPVTTKDGLPMYRQLSQEETMERVYNVINNITRSNIVTDRMKNMEMLKNINAALSVPTPTTQAPVSQSATPSQPTVAPMQTTQVPAQPTSANLTDLSAQPTQTQQPANPMNLVGDLANMMFGRPSGNAPTVATPAKAATKKGELTDEQIDNLKRKPDETDEDFAERQADSRAGLRKKEFSKAGGEYRVDGDGTERFAVKDVEFLNDEERGRYTLESDEYSDGLMEAQKLVNERKAKFEEEMEAERKRLRAEALKKHPTSKVKRNRYVEKAMDGWTKQHDPRIARDTITQSALRNPLP